MRRIDIVKVFDRLCSFECDILKNINLKQGEAAAPLNICELAERLVEPVDKVRKAVKRLVATGILIAEGVNFKIDESIYKEPAAGTKQ